MMDPATKWPHMSGCECDACTTVASLYDELAAARERERLDGEALRRIKELVKPMVLRDLEERLAAREKEREP